MLKVKLLRTFSYCSYLLKKMFKKKKLPSGYAGLHDTKENKYTLEDTGF